jgi:hypothetical protein
MPLEPPTSTESLVEALAARLHMVDLIGWAQITARAEKLGLSFEDLRLLLALTTREGPSSVSDLARISGFSLDAVGRLHRHRCHVLDLVTPTPGRVLFGPAVTISYFPCIGR